MYAAVIQILFFSHFIYSLYSYLATWKYVDMFILEISFKFSQRVIHN